MSLRLAALDLSLRATGVAWTPGVATTNGWPIGLRTITGGDLGGHPRLNNILLNLAMLDLATAQLVVIERPFDNPKTPGTNLELAGLQWLVRHWLWLSEVPYVLVAPATRAKYATGSGRSDKATVLRLTRARYSSFTAAVGDDNQADALALLAMALDAYGAALAPSTDQQREAVRAVQWPRLRLPALAEEATTR